jgi:hypothetical protein
VPSFSSPASRRSEERLYPCGSLVLQRGQDVSINHKLLQVIENNGGDDGTRTRGLCRDSLGIIGVSATYILAGAAKSLNGTVGTVPCG